MKLQHQTQVSASPQRVWEFLQDTRAVVTCLPGAELVDELGDDRYQGVLRVAIGPLKMNYAGDVAVVERDSSDLRIVLNATGRDKRGSGAVEAHVQLQVSSTDDGAQIDVVSDLDLTGRIASLGRGVRDVSNKMFVDFARQLVDRVENPEGTVEPEPAAVGAPTDGEAGSPGVQAATQAPVRSVGHPAAHGQTAGGEIKVFPLVWSVTRERLADFLSRLSDRVRPR